MSTAHLSAVCKVCGEGLGRDVCTCAKCGTPFHPECFTYAGGCSIFGCGGMSATLENGPSAAQRCIEYWSTCGVFEGLSLAGQTWFAGFAAGALFTGAWSGSAALGTAAALTLLAHLNAAAALCALGWKLTSPAQVWPLESLKAIAAARLSALRRSRALLCLAAAALAAGLAVMAIGGQGVHPAWVPAIVAAVVLFPWFSLQPRWRIEEPLLKAAGNA